MVGLGLLWSCDFSGATFYAPNAYGIWKYTVALSQWSESQHATGTFIAEYGVTTFAEIRDAYLADMPVYCNYQNRIYFLTRENLQSEQAGTFVFSRNEYISAAMLTCMGSSGGTSWASAAGSLQPALTAGDNITIETIPPDYDPETNVTTYHGQRISASGGGGGPSLPVGSDADIFIATPYTTPFADIKTAWTAGKVVMCKYGAQGTHNAWYILTDLTESAAASAAMFTAVTSAGNLLTLKALESNGSTTWTNSSVTYRSASAQDTIDAAKQDAAAEVTNASSGAVSQACEDNTIYTFTGALTSLTLTQATGAREYIVIFTTGSTAPTVTPPTGVVFPDGTNTFTAEANKRYEISVRDGFALVGSWAVTV